MHVSTRSGSVVFALLACLALPVGCDLAEKERPPDSGLKASLEEGIVSGEAAPRKIQLNWIGNWKDEDMREALVREIAKDFEFLHSDVTVNLVFSKDLPGSEPNHKKRTADAIVKMTTTGKIEWDVVFLDVAVYEHVSEKLGNPRWITEHLVDFAKVPGFLDSQEDFIVKDPSYKEKIGGMFTGPFIENYIMNVWYNASVADRIGMKIKERGMTFDDFLGYAEKVHLYNKENATSISFIKLPAWNRVDFLFETLFKSLFDDFESAVEKTFNEKKRQAFLETLIAFEKLSNFQPIFNTNPGAISFEEFVKQMLYDDDALFILGGTFLYSHFNALDKEKSRKMRLAENPYLRNHNGLVGDYTPVFAVMEKSGNRDLAVELLMSWAKPGNAEKWVKYAKNLTGSKRHLPDIVTKKIDYFDDVHELYITDMEEKYRGIPMVYLRTPTYIFGDRNPVDVTEFRSKLTQILAGDLKAREYFEDVMARMGENTQ